MRATTAGLAGDMAKPITGTDARRGVVAPALAKAPGHAPMDRGGMP
jgi:hypothetical protein